MLDVQWAFQLKTMSCLSHQIIPAHLTLQVMHGLSNMSLWVRIPLLSVQQQQQMGTAVEANGLPSTLGAQQPPQPCP